MASHRFFWVLLLPMLLMPWQQSARLGVTGMNVGVEEDNKSSTNSSSHVLMALNYPSIRIGPYSWRYFRVEVPRAFAELSISLTRKWAGEHIGNHEARVPMVCFRFGSPPLPDSVLESPQAAAMAAGQSENLLGTGKCAWFYANSSISLTNMEIVAGVWYVGVFSDSQPSRFQSKMITRGSIFTFGIHFTMFGCNSPNLRGHNCDVNVKPLCYQTSNSSLNSRHSNIQNLEDILIGQRVHFANEIPDLNGPIISIGEKAQWTSLMLEHVGPKAWKYYVIEIVDFSLRLQVRAECKYYNPTSKGFNETREANIYLKYGTLPNENDNGTAIGLVPIIVSMPKRGLWYIGVQNFNMTQPLDFDLYWHIDTCIYSTAGDNCILAINSMERVLIEDDDESPFNSFYRPIEEENQLYSPWFSLSKVTHIGYGTSSNWTYFFVEVPQGTSGGVLSIHLRHVEQTMTSIYARLEGLATLENWDVKGMKMERKKRTSTYSSFFNATMKRKLLEVKQKEKNEMSLDFVYPTEGIWCIGVHYVKEITFFNETIVKDVQQHLDIDKFYYLRFIQLWNKASKFIVHMYQSFVEWLIVSWRKFCSSMYFYSYSRTLEKAFSTSEKVKNKEVDTTSAYGEFMINSEPPFPNQSFIEISSKKQELDVEMHISIHGCVNKCSGRGHCTTSYESSHLHFYSYCHCDAAHGGIDCSVPFIVPREESLHIWALIGSNFAALLPSFWAIQHQAYSEWVSYIASGIASGFYHSCDAGGWCVLSYDTLQFLDFWLAFLAVIVTCLYIALLKQDMKAMAHVGVAIITAAITKENATSTWNVLLVIFMGLVGLLLSWALECWRLQLTPSWLNTIYPIRPTIRFGSIYYYGERILNCLKMRFRWFYLSIGLGILCASRMSWILETADTYWIWHSLWHVSIYSSAFFILCSTSKPSSTFEVITERHEHANLQQSNDLEASPMLQQTIELDAIASDRSLDD